jgi:hypothetical protein
MAPLEVAAWLGWAAPVVGSPLPEQAVATTTTSAATTTEAPTFRLCFIVISDAS